MATHPDAIIVGVGVIGSAIAFELAKAGWRVLSVDRNRQPGHGSTSASSAIIRMHYSTLEGTALAWEGCHHWRDWAGHVGLPAGTPLARFHRTGCLVLDTGEAAALERYMEHSRALGCPFEVWGADDLRGALPGVCLDRFGPPRRLDDPNFGEPTGGTIGGGVFWPDAGFVNDPALAAQNLADAAAVRGAVRRMGAEVAEVLTRNGRVAGVRLADGEAIHAPVVVNAAGPGSARLNGMAGVTGDMTIATRPLRQEVVHLPAPEALGFGIVMSDGDAGVYSRPETGGAILVGSQDPACDPHDWAESDTDFDPNFSDQWTTQALRFAQRLPDVGIPSRLRGVVALYDAATDWIPVYDRSSLPGFYMACGTSGNQFKTAPVAGRLMASLIARCEDGADHDRDPLQFRLPRAGVTIDTGVFSRRRPVTSGSTFSVLG